MKSLSKPPIKVETFKRNLRRELMAQAYAEAMANQQQERGVALYWGFLVSSLSAAMFAATAILFIAIPSLPARLHQALGGHPQQGVQAVTQDFQSFAQNPAADYRPVNLNRSDMQFLEGMFQQELPHEGFDPALLEDDGEVVLRRYRDASGRLILVVTETEEPASSPNLDARVY